MSDRTILGKHEAKWHQVPGSLLHRLSTVELLELSDDRLLDVWERMRVDTSDGVRALQVRGWYHLLYAAWVRGLKVLEIGPGIGIDGLTFAALGAQMTFVDINRSNLDLVRRLALLKGLREQTCLHLTDFEQLDTLERDYDVVFAFGSLHHLPSDTAKPEFEALARRLKPGGRFIMHAYPYQRWKDEGELPFDRWGELTDGPGTPWAEWYDTKKVVAQLRPERFAPVLYCEFRYGAMNCIDLVKVEGHAALAPAMPPGARRMAGSVDLSDLQSFPHWGSTTRVLDQGSVLITTSSSAWSYAAMIPIHRDRLPPDATRAAIVLHLTVLTGRIGAAVVGDDGSSVLVEEYASEDAGEQTCVAYVERAAEAASVILRNAASGQTTRVVVHRVDLFAL